MNLDKLDAKVITSVVKDLIREHEDKYHYQERPQGNLMTRVLENKCTQDDVFTLAGVRCRVAEALAEVKVIPLNSGRSLQSLLEHIEMNLIQAIVELSGSNEPD